MAKVGEIIMKVITNIILAFLAIAVFFMSYSYIIINFAHKDYVNYFGYTVFEVATGSMANTININDLIVVKLNTKYQEGDIITYQNNHDYITHRVLKIDEYTGTITAKGDANNAVDANISPNEVIGKVVKIYPKLGVWKKVILTPKVVILMFGTLVLFNFAFSYNKKQRIQKNKMKNEEAITLKKIKSPKEKTKHQMFHHSKEKLPFRK